jgi:segregation and condensation protein B
VADEGGITGVSTVGPVEQSTRAADEAGVAGVSTPDATEKPTHRTESPGDAGVSTADDTEESTRPPTVPADPGVSSVDLAERSTHVSPPTSGVSTTEPVEGPTRPEEEPDNPRVSTVDPAEEPTREAGPEPDPTAAQTPTTDPTDTKADDSDEHEPGDHKPGEHEAGDQAGGDHKPGEHEAGDQAGGDHESDEHEPGEHAADDHEAADHKQDDHKQDEDEGEAEDTGLPPLTDDTALTNALEALLLVVDSPATEELLSTTLDQPVARITDTLHRLSATLADRESGIDLRRVGDGWRFVTRDKYAPFVEKLLLDGQRAKLTRAALETLAVIAYRQPVTRARVAAVRGVNVDGVIRTLVTRGLIGEAGTDSDTGGILYRTTELFLERLGLSSLEDLPPIAPLLPEVDAIDDV